MLLFGMSSPAADKPNVLLIICDDLNDYLEPLGGHPQAKTPNIARLFESAVSFRQAHCNIPICNPSRASLITGIYPHTSQVFGFEPWNANEVLKNSRTMMKHFSRNGYHTLGTGKILHNHGYKEWDEFGNASDYGPFPNDGTKNVAHPDVPAPFRDDFGAVDGSF
ncbi:MAG: sulfatase-like hydrolase/transferase, partial [Verrucomicrobiota bacterium]